MTSHRHDDGTSSLQFCLKSLASAMYLRRTHGEMRSRTDWNRAEHNDSGAIARHDQRGIYSEDCA